LRTSARGDGRKSAWKHSESDQRPHRTQPVERIAVDALAVSGGFSPNIQLACHHRGRPVWDEDKGVLLATDPPPGMIIAGAAAGHFAISACVASGAEAGTKAAEDCGYAVKKTPLPPCSGHSADGTAFFHSADTKGFAFVDLQTDVTVKDIDIAVKEGFRSVEHLKRYTALGMGADQGKLSNLNGLAILAEKTGRTIAETGTTIYRPPYTPVSFGALVGHHRGKDFRPTRLTPTHFWAKKLGAKFTETGAWLRAQYFPRPGETDWLQTVQREVKAVRSSVGMIDVSTFGKIDLQGPDAGKLLDRVYVNTFSTLPVGKARYGVMLREDGMVMDDGTTARLAERPLGDDDHDGQRRQGVFAPGVLFAGAVAGPRRAHGFDLRAMGADCRCRAERPQSVARRSPTIRRGWRARLCR
jgi:hypothetical protein